MYMPLIVVGIFLSRSLVKGVHGNEEPKVLIIPYYECGNPTQPIPLPQRMNCETLEPVGNKHISRFVRIFTNEVPKYHTFQTYEYYNLTYSCYSNFFYANTATIVSQTKIFYNLAEARSQRDKVLIMEKPEIYVQDQCKIINAIEEYGNKIKNQYIAVKQTIDLPVLEADKSVLLFGGDTPMSKHRDFLSNTIYYLDKSIDEEQIDMKREFRFWVSVESSPYGLHLYNWSMHFSAHIGSEIKQQIYHINGEVITGYRSSEKSIISYIPFTDSTNLSVSDVTEQFSNYLQTYTIHMLSETNRRLTQHMCDDYNLKYELALSMARTNPDFSLKVFYPFQKYKGFLSGLQAIVAPCLRNIMYTSCEIDSRHNIIGYTVDSQHKEISIHPITRVRGEIWDGESVNPHFVEVNHSHILDLSKCVVFPYGVTDPEKMTIVTDFAGLYYENFDEIKRDKMLIESIVKKKVNTTRLIDNGEYISVQSSFYNDALKYFNIDLSQGYLAFITRSTSSALFAIVCGIISIKVLHWIHIERDITWLMRLPFKKQDFFRET